jgi:hypothetical protein
MVFDAHATPHQASSFSEDVKGITACGSCLRGKFNSSTIVGLCSKLKSNTENGELKAYNDCLDARIRERVTTPGMVCDKSCKDIKFQSIGDLVTLPLISSGKFYRNMLLSAFI